MSNSCPRRPLAIATLLLLGCVSGGETLPPRVQEEVVRIPGTEVEFRLVRLPGGRARLGSPEGEPGREADEGPVREIDLKPFWIGKLEVTWDEYSLYYESRRQAKVDGVTRPTQPDVIDPKEPFPNGGEQTGRHPALGIGWYGAMGYCEWLSKKTGMDFRLPTEAEWECAARAGDAGAAPAALDPEAWHADNSEARSHEAGTRRPNAWGLHDMLGNVMEFCLEPHAPPDSTGSVRGGGWNSPPAELRYANRQVVLMEKWLERDPKIPLRTWWLTDAPFVGLRVVRTADDGAAAGEREAAIAKLEVRNLKIRDKGKRPHVLSRITGELSYAGTRPLAEVEVTVFYFSEDGKPTLVDPREKPCFNRAYPALANAYHPGPHRQPLKPGETRAFEVEVPFPCDEVGPLDVDKAGARVTRVRFSKN